jgi:hypothetical protein
MEERMQDERKDAPMKHPALRVVVAAVTLGIATATAAPAMAATYTVWSCKGPTGTPNAAAGWTGFSEADTSATNSCATGGSLAAALLPLTPRPGSGAAWQFNAPADTRIVRLSARRATTGLSVSTLSADVAYTLRTDAVTLERCAPSDTSACLADVTGLLDKQGLDAGYVNIGVGCTATFPATCSRPLRLDVAQAAVGLKDDLAPAVANGRLLNSGETSGTLSVGFDASDRGGGVYRALVKVDGQIAGAIPVSGDPCTDADPADGDPYQFIVPVPCPGTANGIVTNLSAASLSPGPHGVEMAVEDAAGNQTTVFGPVEFPRRNAGNAADTQATLRMWFVKARNRGKRYTSRFGQRVVTRGVLRNRRGKGIQGARIDVYHILRNGQRRLVKTGLKSRAGGALTLILPLNLDTRRIEYAYRALRPGPVTSRQRLRLTVLRRNGKIYYKKLRSQPS